MPANEGHCNRFRRGYVIVLVSIVLFCLSIFFTNITAEAVSMEQETVETTETTEETETTETIEETVSKSVTSEAEEKERVFSKDSAETTSDFSDAIQTEETVKETTEVQTTEETTEKEIKTIAAADKKETESTTKEATNKAETTAEETKSVTEETEAVTEETKSVTEGTEAVTEETGANTTSEKTEESTEKKSSENMVQSNVNGETAALPEASEDSVSNVLEDRSADIASQLEAEIQGVSAASLNSRNADISGRAVELNNKFIVENELGQISSCVIDAGTKQVNVTGTFGNSVPGNQVYLMELGAYEYSINGKNPIASGTVSGNTVTLKTDLGENNTASSKLYSKFVLAYSNNGQYVSITNPSYITNPEAISLYNYDFPVASSKKGLQTSIMISDSMDLGVPNAAFNLRLDEFLSDSTGTAFTYKGKTYYFNTQRVSDYDHVLRQYYENNMVVTMIILLGDSDKTANLRYDSASNKNGYSPSNYAIDTSNQSDAQWVEAIMTFLGQRYTREDAQYGQVVNWILGNEINSPKYYNWMGPVSLDTYAAETARTYRIFSTALKSCYNNVRTYFSMDFFWGTIPNNPDPLGAFSTRELLDQLNANLEKEGSINWNLAYHAYPFPFDDPAFWDDDAGIVNDNEDSRIVNLKNIDVLTNYIKDNFGDNVRVLLSEEGFTSSNASGKNLEMKQAAAYAYAYYITESQDMIDALIITRHVDHVGETSQGYYFGLWKNQANAMESADSKKSIWEVFKYIDTPKSLEHTNDLLPYVDGVSAWDSSSPRLSGLDANFFEERSEKVSQKVYTPSAYQSPAYMDVSDWGSEWFDISNKNVYSGYRNIIDGTADFTNKSAFLTKLKINNYTSGAADVKIRVSTGNDYYEADGTYSVQELNAGKIIGIDLSSWAERNKVTKIQVWVRIQGQGNCSITLQECVMDDGNEAKVPVTGGGDGGDSEKSPLTASAAHVQNLGWLSEVDDDTCIGTEGAGLRMEAVKLALKDGESGEITYQAHVQNLGWLDNVSNGEIAGTENRSLRMEAMKINLTGDISDKYDIYYRAHIQNIGWQDWVKNGELCGTENMSLQLEAIKIKLVKKGDPAPTN